MFSTHIYRERREQFSRALGADCAAVVISAPAYPRNYDTEFLYRPDSDMLYLTGFEEDHAVLLFVPTEGGHDTVLFCEENDPARAVWVGERLGPARAAAQTGIQQTYPLSRLDAWLPDLLKPAKKLCTHQFKKDFLNQAFLGRCGVWLSDHQTSDLETYLHPLRIQKIDEEIALMQQAADIACIAHENAMRCCAPGKHEYELEAQLCYDFTRQGARSQAYPAIVGAGKNACILHYQQNNCTMSAGDLVLIDAGCEYGYYASDITRTFPVNGQYTDAQAALYDIVLHTQKTCIAEVKPGVRFSDLQDLSERLLLEGLVSLGILSGDLETLHAEHAVRAFYPHGIGHWIGLDVHDSGQDRDFDKSTPFQPGMCLTVEPGLYIRAEKHVDPTWHNIGIRIEDDVVVTDSGHHVLSGHLAKERSEIEALCHEIL